MGEHIDYEADYFKKVVEERKERAKMERRKEKERLENYKKVLFNIDMVEGFVNFGAMANPAYNELVPEQMRIMDDFIKEGELINLVGEWHTPDAAEFNDYPTHCVQDTKEAEYIPEIRKRVYENNEEDKLLRANDQIINIPNGKLIPNVYDYKKNCINVFLNKELREDIEKVKNIEMAVFNGVCEDLCVFDAARTYARLMAELNRKVAIYVVENTVDTFDAPGHCRQEFKKIARIMLEQAGIKYVKNYEELKDEEKKLGLYNK